MPDGDALPGPVRTDVAYHAVPEQFGNQEVALGIRVGIRGMSDLKTEPGERETDILGASSHPEHPLVIGWTSRGQPELWCIQRSLRAREGHAPEPDVVALARTVVDSLLEPDVLSSPEEIERAEWGRGVGPAEDEGEHHPRRTGEVELVGLRPASGRERAA
jgi:hypothetical protein